MQLTPGSRWKSAVCDTEVVVVKAPKTDVTLECGGQAMIAHAAARPEGQAPAADHAAGTQPGKRFSDEETALEVLCTKGGKGSLAIDGRAITPKEAKKLPASD
ncbi:MAG TPA: hypothetical protein VN806_12665 [Caulobacteraceae bacterium]|nr:hypothetical protein [Caulobacteraceae bacterium]